MFIFFVGKDRRRKFFNNEKFPIYGIIEIDSFIQLKKLIKLKFALLLSDKPMQLNDGRFMQNGRCGYVLMPDCMFEPGFNPIDTTTHTKTTPITLIIEILAGRHLIRLGRGICSPLVEVEVCGIEADDATFRTPTCSKY
jgi:hypothetical protein